jgi:hypothetical protein
MGSLVDLRERLATRGGVDSGARGRLAARLRAFAQELLDSDDLLDALHLEGLNSEQDEKKLMAGIGADLALTLVFGVVALAGVAADALTGKLHGEAG